MSLPSIDKNEEAEIRNNLSPLIEEAKTKKMAAQQLAIDATKLLSVTAERFNESRDQGFFQRCWSKINGKQGESLRANQADLIEMQKYAWCYLISLQDQNLILAQSVAVIRNDLSKLALMETQLANAETETRQAIAELVIRFSKRIENVERDAKTSKWLLAVEVRRYQNYNETFRILKIVSDYFLFFKENNIKFEASLASSPSQPPDLQIAFHHANIDYGKTIKLGDFIQNILSEIMKSSLGEYNKIVCIENGENILDANFVLDNISGSAYVALYHVSEHYQIVDKFARRAKSEGDLQFYAETLKDFMQNAEINLDYEYSIIDLAKEILAGHFLAVDIYNEQHGIVVEYDSIEEASSDASISSMLATYNKVDYHYLAETECSIEDRKNYIESFSALGLSNSEEQHHYILALSSLFEIPENDSYLTETPANKFKRIMPSLIKLLNSLERKLAWIMDAVFLATRDGVIDSEEIETIHGICRMLNMRIGDIDSFIDYAKTIAVSTSRDEVYQAISAIKEKTDSWRTVIDFKKEFSFDEELRQAGVDGSESNSIDFNSNWTVHDTPLGSEHINTIICDGNIWIALGYSNSILSINNGISWEKINIPRFNYSSPKLIYCNSKWLVYHDYENKLFLSSNGQDWNVIDVVGKCDGNAFKLKDIIFDGKNWIILASNIKEYSYTEKGLFFDSAKTGIYHHGMVIIADRLDGKWNTHIINDSCANGVEFNRIAYANEKYILAGSKARLHVDDFTPVIATSANGINWTERKTPLEDSYTSYDLAYGNGVWVAVNGKDKIAFSCNGFSWEQANVTNQEYGYFCKVLFIEKCFVATLHGHSGKFLAFSLDGKTWELYAGPGFSVATIAYRNGILMAGGSEGTLATCRVFPELVNKEEPANEPVDASAQFNLGMGYQIGDGVVQDMNEAIKYFRLAATQGHADAQNRLGWCYETATGVREDMTEAAKWYLKAAEQGLAKAQRNLGCCYMYGKGVPKDEVEAAKWYHKAAEQGYAIAQDCLGLCYHNGTGVAKDMKEAVKWYRQAAEQDYADAQYNLGVCYKIGDGVTKDEVEAVKWLRKAADQGDADAQFNLGLCYRDGDGVVKDLTEAVTWYLKAAEQGHANAQFNLGVCYRDGDGVTKDLTESAEWYRKAAEQGYPAHF